MHSEAYSFLKKKGGGGVERGAQRALRLETPDYTSSDGYRRKNSEQCCLTSLPLHSSHATVLTPDAEERFNFLF